MVRWACLYRLGRCLGLGGTGSGLPEAKRRWRAEAAWRMVVVARGARAIYDGRSDRSADGICDFRLLRHFLRLRLVCLALSIWTASVSERASDFSSLRSATYLLYRSASPPTLYVRSFAGRLRAWGLALVPRFRLRLRPRLRYLRSRLRLRRRGSDGGWLLRCRWRGSRSTAELWLLQMGRMGWGRGRG